MKRWLLNVAVAVSLVACVLSITLSLRSSGRLCELVRRRCDALADDRRESREFIVGAADGRLRFQALWKVVDLKVVDANIRQDAASTMLQDYRPQGPHWIYHESDRFGDFVARESPLVGNALRLISDDRPMAPALPTLGHYSARGLTVSLPVVATLTALPPIVWTSALLLRRRRRQLNRCVNCGYDLRETPLRCPECGASPESAARPVA